jgi:hypothetical protein
MSDHWSRVTELFNAALERGPGERAAFLDAACGGDPACRAEVDSLLAAHDRADRFMDVSAPVASGLVDGAAPTSMAGRTIGPYRLEREIGRGGMGAVHLAEDTRLGRPVAVKILPAEFSADPARRDRLRREARAAAALSHPGIATVYSLEEQDGTLCLVTEYIRGDTLRSEIERGPLPLDLVLDTGIQVARGLAAAHAGGVIHRDLKPENVIRNREGVVKILDFGIASIDEPAGGVTGRLTDDRTLLGTPGYMSPEQLDGGDVDARSDIFALGVLLFELAAGRNPFLGSTPASTAARVLAAEPPPLPSIDPRLPPSLDAVVRRCLRRHRADRYQSALDVARDLDDLRAGRRPVGEPVSTTPARGARSALWWWRLHQVARMLVEAALVFPVWMVHETVRNDWTLAVMLAVIVTAAVNGTLRAHLLFTAAFNPDAIGEQLRRALPLVRGTDLALSALLLVSAAPVARAHLSLAGILAAFGVGWAVTSTIVEPAVCSAAFPGRAAPAR